MQRQRGELVPVGEVIADLDGPVKALRETPPPARRGFTLADQVDQLVGASEADPDRGFMARTMALCSLPRSNPGNRLQYKRVNGPVTLYMTVTGGNKLPFGNLPRLILAWLCAPKRYEPKVSASWSWGNRWRTSCERSAFTAPENRRKVHPPPQPDEAAVWLPASESAGLWGCAARNDQYKRANATSALIADLTDRSGFGGTLEA